MSFFSKELKFLKKSFTSIRIIKTFGYDLLFYLTSGISAFYLLTRFSNKSKALEAKLLEIGSMSNLSSGTSEALAGSLKGLMLSGFFYSILAISIIFFLYVFIKNMIYSTLTNKKSSKKKVKQFALFSITWFILGLLIFAFSSFMLLSMQQIAPETIPVGIFLTMAMYCLLGYISMQCNLEFYKISSYKAYISGIRNSLTIKKIGIPIIAFILVFNIANYLWGLAFRTLPDSFRLNGFGLLIILIMSWFRYYINMKNRK